MHRSLAIRLTAIIVILAATAATLAAQGRGFRGGGGVSVFRGAPPVRSVPGPAFFSRPGRPIVASPVAPFVSSPVAPFVSSPVGPPLRGGPFFFGGLSDRKSTRLNSSHLVISYAVFCLKKKKKNESLVNFLCSDR